MGLDFPQHFEQLQLEHFLVVQCFFQHQDFPGLLGFSHFFQADLLSRGNHVHVDYIGRNLFFLS